MTQSHEPLFPSDVIIVTTQRIFLVVSSMFSSILIEIRTSIADRKTDRTFHDQPWQPWPASWTIWSPHLTYPINTT
jgi:hypothetical protein